ncbi:unnamed protein product [Cuscuta europaea]|uniref:Uncharacterized protein n=1 Tax=Cuscuta europaea TaxID=41803 RepID=A0A9P1E5P5_CUSEU|nr:unnamed protein product [Cuscuta europaea]
MAEDDRSITDLNERYVNNEEASTSYCKDYFTNNSNIVQEDDDHKDWLQLTVGGGGNSSATVNHDGRDHEEHGRTRLGPVELDLLPSGRPTGGYVSTAAELRHPQSIPPPSAVGYYSSTLSNYNNILQHPPWAFRPVMATPPQGHPVAGSSSSSPFLYAPPVTGSRFVPRPAAFPLVYAGAGVVFPGFDCRVIDPPRRQHSGIWFSLQASQNQRKEPYLRQISKKYIRIKDGRMTVLFVLKYLVNKLHLENESEIEITCRGQELPPSLTLQHVRDEIWMRNYPQYENDHSHAHILHPNLLTFVPTSHHVMVLLYGRK